MVIQSQDREEWAHHPVTQEFLKGLIEARQQTLEVWAREGYVAETGEKTLQANAKALGGVDLLTQTIELIEGYTQVADDNELPFGDIA